MDRRERRRADKADPADETAPDRGDDSAAGLVAGSALALAEPIPADADAESMATAVNAVARRTLVAPVLPGDASPRAIERTRVQLQQAEQAIATAPDLAALVAPLVRHVNSVTEQLNEAQLTVGKLAAERDALRHRLADSEGIPIEDIPVLTAVAVDGEADAEARRLLRIEARESAITPEERKPNPLRPVGVRMGFVPASDAFDDLKRMARRRQIFAATLIAGLVIGIWMATSEGRNLGAWAQENLAGYAYVGLIFQAFIMAWMFYRVVRVGGKGVRWIFPDPHAPKKRRR
jgi:hypothetical protein